LSRFHDSSFLNTGDIAGDIANESVKVFGWVKSARGSQKRTDTFSPLNESPEQGGSMIALQVNGTKRQADVDPGTPLLWVLRDNLGITSVKYACGIAECGMCTVLIDGIAQRSCAVEVEEVLESEITTIEGLADTHPVKVAWIEKQVPQCGYCQPGIMLQAVDFLSREPDPSAAQINKALDDVICRCGSHPRIKKAIQLAARMTAKQGG
jgi:isoquinoline 1-oxidoreductase subunit alpha